MKSLITRSLSGIVYVALILAAILCGAPYFALLVALFTCLAILELNKLFNANDTLVAKISLAITTLCGMLIGFLPLESIVPRAIVNPLSYLGFLMIATPLIILSLAVFNKSSKALRAAVVQGFSLVYIAVSMFMLSMLYYANVYGYSGKYVVLMMFILIWINDTGAYCVGMMFGRHPMCKRLSPKKSMEGLFGGIAFSIVASVATWWVVDGGTVWAWIGLALVVSIFATIGDLFESLIKRTIGVKDSGRLIPGHGGILDRIDSLLFVAPAVAIYTVLLLVL